MSLLLFDGFDNTPDDRFVMIPDPNVGTPHPDSGVRSGGGRNGTDGYRLTSDDCLAVPFGTTITSGNPITFGFALYIDALPVGARPLVSFSGALSTFQCINFDESGQIGLGIYTTRTWSTGTLSVGAWQYVEVEYVAHDSAGVCKIWLDGVQVLDFSGDTRYATSNISTLWFGPDDNNSDFTIDDLYVLDDTGAAPFNARLGDVHVKHLGITGAGNYSQATGSDGNQVDNHLLVDEVPADSADYVEFDATTQRESYSLDALGAGEVPLAVRASAHVGNGGLSQAMDGFLRIGGTDYDAGDTLPVAAAFNWRDTYWTTNPNTASAWVEDDLDSAEVGIQRTV